MNPAILLALVFVIQAEGDASRIPAPVLIASLYVFVLAAFLGYQVISTNTYREAINTGAGIRLASPSAWITNTRASNIAGFIQLSLNLYATGCPSAAATFGWTLPPSNATHAPFRISSCISIFKAPLSIMSARKLVKFRE